MSQNKQVVFNNILKITFFLLLTSICFYSCSKKDSPKSDATETYTSLPADITKLFAKIEIGDANSDTVVLFSQGGPRDSLAMNSFNDFCLPQYYNLTVHQTNTYNKGIIALSKNLTQERAAIEDSLSAVILNQVIKYFYDKGKKVFVVSHSFGSFVVPLTMSMYGTDMVSKYLIMAGRLDMDDIVVQGFSNRIGYQFVNGINPVAAPINPTEYTTKQVEQAYATVVLQGMISRFRYTERLKNKKLTNLIYAYGEYDKAVGRLSNDEIAFLESKGSTVYKVAEGSHGEMFDPPHNTNLINKLFGK